jgi:hypothetical protein
VATPTANSTLKANGLFCSSTAFATAGAMETTQPHNITPSKNANASCAGYPEQKNSRAKGCRQQQQADG